MKILALSPHTDDCEVGCGAILAKLKNNNHEIKVVAFSHTDDKRLIEEMTSAMAELKIDDFEILEFERRRFPLQRQKILNYLFDMNETWHPDVVFVPASTDIHQDHQVVHNEAIRAFKRSTIYGYFVPGNNFTLKPNKFFTLSEIEVNRKISAMKCYKSQDESPHREEFFKIDNITNSLRFWGKQVGATYAEVCEVIRIIDD